MARFDRGVKYYTHGSATIDVAFPEESIMCRYCRFLRADANGARHKCVLTDEILLKLDAVGLACPVRVREDEA